MPEQDQCPIAGPASLAIRQSSPRGPFAARSDRMALDATNFSIVNASAAPCMVDGVTLDPLRRDPTGTGVDAGLRIDPGAPLPCPLAQAEAMTLLVHGDIPARPGAYATTARIMVKDDGGLAVPVSISVPASPLWGIGCMMLGLLLLGTVNLLAGEGSVKGRLHDALRARQDIHTLLESNPAPQSRQGDVDAMDHSFDTAIAMLGARRSLSMVDHRLTDAQAQLDAANKRADGLRADLAGRPRGAAEIDDVRHQWGALQSTLQQIAALPTTAAAQPSPGLAGKLDAFLLRYRTRLLRDPAVATGMEIGTELGRMDLQEAASEGDAARDLAINTSLWLRRSALVLNRALTGYRTAVIEAGWMVNSDTTLRDRAARDDMAPEGRAAILALLDKASAEMDGDAWLDEWGKAHALLDDAWTEQTRAVTTMQKRRVDELIADIDRQTDTADVTALQDQLQAAPKPHTLAMKQAGMTQVLALWRGHAAGMAEPAARASFVHRIDAIQAIVNSGKIMDALTPYRDMLNAWAAWNEHLVAQALDRLDHPRCVEIAADVQRSTAQIEATLRERPPGRQLEEWDRALDGIRLDLLREGPDAVTITPNCIQPVLDIDKRAIALSRALFAASVIDIPLPAATRLRLAQSSGVQTAIDMTQANKDQSRRLTLASATPAEERVVGRTLKFVIGGADPVWGASALVRVDFGDATPAFQTSAEAIRQGAQITHVYGVPKTVHLGLTVTAEGKKGAAPTLLGQGTETVLVAPSPVSAAQTVADEFVNLRFGLALAIAATVYFWRYHARTTVFGARGYDYVEAFALGFAVDAAVSNLPHAIAGFAAG
jgi:hypothetical protein